MIHWEIQPMIGHKLLMLLEQVLSLNVFTHRTVEFLRYLCPDVRSIVHHLGSCLIWKEHLPDLLMGALQLNLLYILYFAAEEPNVFLLFYDHSLSDKQAYSSRQNSLFLITVSQAKVFTPRQLKRTLSPPVLEDCRSAVMSRNNNILAVWQSSANARTPHMDWKYLTSE